MHNKSLLYGIILASGQSRRMGCNKLLLPYKGMPIIEHVLKKMVEINLKKIVVVFSENEQGIVQILQKYPCQMIANPMPTAGMGHSLSLAVQSLPGSAQGVIILLGDQPDVEIEDLLRLKDEFEENDHPIIRTRYRNGQVGHPVLFSKRFFPLLAAVEGDMGGKEIIRNHPNDVHYIRSTNNGPNDIDTPADYLQLLQGRRGESLLE